MRKGHVFFPLNDNVLNDSNINRDNSNGLNSNTNGCL